MSNVKKYQYRVCAGGSVMVTGPARKSVGDRTKRLMPGDIIPNDAVTDKWIEDALRNRTIEPVFSMQQVPVERGPVADVPGVEPGAPVGGDETRVGIVNRDQGNAERVNRIATSGGDQTPPVGRVEVGGIVVEVTPAPPEGTTPSPGQPVQQVGSIWNLDPERLQGKTLEELNVMVKERDTGVPLFETIPEAVVFLSKDFKRA
jgi:hypothetical protein